MSLANIIRNMQTHLNDAYDALEEKGATIPEAKNLNNLATTVQSVTTGGGGEGSGSGGDGFDINGIIEEYYVYAGDNISAGDFVNFVEGIANRTITEGVSVDTSEFLINTITRDYAYRHQALLLSDQKRIVLTHSYSSNIYVCVLLVENGVISMVSGSDKLMFSNQREATAMVEVENDRILFIGPSNTSYNVVAMVGTIGSDNKITFGGSATISTTSYGAPKAHKIGPNKVFIAYGGKSGSNAGAVVATVTDANGVSLGERTEFPVTATCLSTVKLNDNQILVTLDCENHIAYYCNINDTTITTSGGANLNTKPSCWVAKTILLNPTTALYLFDDESTDDWPLVGQILTLGTTISAGEVFTVDPTQYAGNALEVVQLMNGKMVICVGVYGDDGCYINVIVCDYVDNALVELSKTRFESPKYGEFNGQNLDMYLFDNDDFGITYDDGDGSLMATQIYSLDNTTNQIVPIAHKTTVETEYEIQVQKSKNNVFNGIAKTAGVGGNNMGHNEKIEIYTL